MKDRSVAPEFDPATEIKFVGWLVMAVVVVAFMIAAAVQNDTRQAQSEAALHDAQSFVLQTDAMLSSLQAAEAARGLYLLTGDPTSKTIFADKIAGVEKHLKLATTIAFENADQLDRLGAISSLLQKRIDLNKEAVRLLPQGAARAAMLFTNADARADLRELERLVGANRAVENRLLARRDETLRRHTQRTEQILYAGGALNLMLLALAFYVVRNDLKARRSAAVALEVKIQEAAEAMDAVVDKLQLEKIEHQWGQAALQRIVGHHELVLNSMQEGIFVVSKNGHIISANPAAANLTRREAKQLAGKLIGSVLLDGDRLPFPWEKHFLRTPLKNGRPILPKPATVKQADGGLVDVQLACYPTRDRENLTGAVITVVRNHSPMQ